MSDDGVTQLSILDISRAEPYDEGMTGDQVINQKQKYTWFRLHVTG